MNQRQRAVQRRLAQQGLEALVLTHPPNLAYLARFFPTPRERLIALIVPRQGQARLIVPALEEGSARASCGAALEVLAWLDEDGPLETLGRALGDLILAPGRIGIEKEHLSVKHWELLSTLVPAESLVAGDGIVGSLRIVKDSQELEHLRAAAAIVDRVIGRLRSELREGRSEAELAAEAETLLRSEGGERLAADAIVLSGVRSSLPSGQAGARTLAAGDLVMIDLGVVSDGYCADITRTFVLGKPTERQWELFDVVRAAQRAAIQSAVPGTKAADVDRAARRVIEAAGYGQHFPHRVGHGLGLEVHEPPYLAATNQAELTAGMVVTIEPGVYVAGYGGVRIEDDIVIGDPPEVLTRSPLELELASA